jgi:hypothetical protein
MLKKVFNSIFQASVFLLGHRKRNGRLELQVIETGWPDSKWRNRFLKVGELCIKENELFTKVEGRLYNLARCPQRDFFEKLDHGKSLDNDQYYLLAKQQLDAADFEFWLETRKSLWLNFSEDDSDFKPIVAMSPSGKFLIEDGAHRLALRSLRGYLSHRVALSLWTLGAQKLSQ